MRQAIWAVAAVVVLSAVEVAAQQNVFGRRFSPTNNGAFQNFQTSQPSRQDAGSRFPSSPSQNTFRQSSAVPGFAGQRTLGPNIPTSLFSSSRSDKDLNQYIRGLVQSSAAQGFTVSPTAYVVDRKTYFYSPTDYMYYYVLSDGTAVSQQGGVRDNGAFYQDGFYSYVLDDNRRQTTYYTADDKGYNPSVKIEEPGDLSGAADFCKAALCG